MRPGEGARPAGHPALTGLVVLPAALRPARAWKNGGGLTYDVAAHPVGSDLDSFAWRISIARVDAEGPFSLFPGVDRTLALLDGELELDFGVAGSTARLAPLDPPCRFGGDVKVTGRPGPAGAHDLNLMVRRGRAQGAMRWLAPTDAAPDAGGEATRLVLATAPTEVTFGDQACGLARWDAVLFRGPGEITVVGASPALLVEVGPALADADVRA